MDIEDVRREDMWNEFQGLLAPYRIGLRGKVNKGVYSCRDCDFKAPDYNVTPYLLGFAESSEGVMCVWECPECFGKWYFHARFHSALYGWHLNYLFLLKAYRQNPEDYFELGQKWNKEFKDKWSKS